MTTPKRRADRRTQRTRQVLQQAFRDIVQDKGFSAASIRDITERANVNRGTFYLHFTDKYTLAEEFAREVFRERLASALPDQPGWNARSLQLLIRTVLECLEEKYRHQPRALYMLGEAAPLVERAMRDELTELLLTWLKQRSAAGAQSLAPLDTVAQVVSWTIFGTAVQWSQQQTGVPLEELESTISLVIIQGLARLIPEPGSASA
jgi:AcrR family transcriptional regulator